MKRKVWATLLLLLLLAGSVFLFLTTYEMVKGKISLEHPAQQTIKMLDPNQTAEETNPEAGENSHAAVPEAQDAEETDETEDEEEAVTSSSHNDEEVPVRKEEKPEIVLISDQLILNEGQSFRETAAVAELKDDKDSRETLLSKVQVEGTYDLKKVGEYNLTYTVTDTDGNESDPVSLKLIVKKE